MRATPLAKSKADTGDAENAELATTAKPVDADASAVLITSDIPYTWLLFIEMIARLREVEKLTDFSERDIVL